MTMFMPVLFFVLVYILPYALTVILRLGPDSALPSSIIVFAVYAYAFRFRTCGRAAVVSLFSFDRGYVLALVAATSVIMGFLTVYDTHQKAENVIATIMVITFLLTFWVLRDGPAYGWDIRR